MRGTGNQRGLMGSASAFGLLVDHWDTTGIVGIDEILEQKRVLEDQVRLLKIVKSWRYVLEVGGKCGNV